MGNHFKIYIKHLAKNKLYTFITISGFAVSLMFVFLLGVYIRQELSVDQFHANKDRIYRLSHEDNAGFGPLIGATLKSQFPGIETFTRIAQGEVNGRFQGNELTRFKWMMADSSFFTMFSYKLLAGETTQVLATKNSAVLSESFARKIYGNENPVGKWFTAKDLNLQITGIVRDMPDNTHFEKCDIILNYNCLPELWGEKDILRNNDNSSFGLYLMAKPGTNLPAKAPQILAQFKKDYWMYKQDFVKTVKFEPLTEVYFSKEWSQAVRQNTRTTIFIFGGIALLILIIAIINYVNLTIAQSGFRSKETAIKRLMGGSQNKLLLQQVTESIALSFFAAFLAIGLAFTAEPFFNTQMGCHLNLKSQINFAFLLEMIGSILLIGFVSGIVPALAISKLNPVEVVKGNVLRTNKNGYAKALIAFQYGVAIILLVCTLTISRQSDFIQNYDMGFNRENLFWMENTIKPGQKEVFRDLLKAIPGVSEVSYCCGAPGSDRNNISFEHSGKPVSFNTFAVDSTFFKLFGIKVVPTNVAYSKKGVWLNKTGIQTLGLGENPVSFRIGKSEFTILGIIDNFNYESLYDRVEPLLITQLEANEEPWKIIVKLNGTNTVQAVGQIKKAQSSFTGGIPMDSGFVDDNVNQWYISAQKQSKLIGAFTLLSILISSMGIFAMSLYYIQQKVKEIGIRKVNGARISEVISMLNRDFVRWVTIAFVIATPIAYYAMHRWLENFAYQTSLSWWIFALAGLLALGIALLTVSWQSWKAATRNPVEALRYE